ncbi:Gfo/Idh/MocA family oxidoreductase [Lentisphaerota bacterium ZTH]|nr:Gfo/Idh/MocA family oxidoreductase [Lentisphaerota bacterium]WET06390.1 Gfo/Idh/MocA family oxidoreductase [Lentisphaerota bacterium ZTH]
MAQKQKALDLTIIGAGMIVNDLLLPAAMQMQRQGVVNEITVCDMRESAVKALKESESLRETFPNQSFKTCPEIGEGDSSDPELYKKVLARQDPYNLVIIALPDQLHYPVLKGVLPFNQHILCVKPLVLKYDQALEIEKEARERGVFIGIEYHKRFDRRSLVARKHYRQGNLGDFALGESKLVEPYYYRHSNFQNWFTCENTDPFVYVGCHYVDLVCFITGLKPVQVSVTGRKGIFPNGKEGYMWSNGRVVFENGGILSVNNGLGYPDDAAGGNDQGLVMYFDGDDCSGLLDHDDHNRGAEYSFARNMTKKFQYINPDFIRTVPWEGEGLKPIGYGIDSVAATLISASAIEAEVEENPERAMEIRRQAIADANARGLIATPENSAYNELVQEAARLSILNDGDVAVIDYSTARPTVKLKNA